MEFSLFAIRHSPFAMLYVPAFTWAAAAAISSSILTRTSAAVMATPLAVKSLTTLFWTRSEERRVGKSVSVRVDLGGRRIIKKKNIRDQVINIMITDKRTE